MKPVVFTPTKIKHKVFVSLLPDFFSEIDDDFKNLQTFSTSSNMKEIGNIAHKIKGTSKGYGAQLMADTAYTLELTARSNDANSTSSVARIIEQLNENIETTRKYAETHYQLKK